MAHLEGDLQGSELSIGFRGNIHSRSRQQLTDHIDMALDRGYEERGDTSMVGLVGLDPVRAEQRTHDVQVAILARHEQWWFHVKKTQFV